MAERRLQTELSITTRGGDGFRVVGITYVCPFCGDRKKEALDVCTDPDRTCRGADGG